MTSSDSSKIKTGVYIDGYNLYYGRLRGTPFKWLDVVKLFEAELVRRGQGEELIRVHFFTAYALANFATNGQASVEAQSAYHRALKTLYADKFEAIYGNHSYDPSGTLLPTFVPGEKYDRLTRTRVWKLEEKKTDVNLALRMYRDARNGLYDRIILVSNDSDAEPALEAIRADFPHIMIGVITPLSPPPPGVSAPRRASGSLANQAHWVVNNMTDTQLQEAQLPAKIPTKKKPIYKPPHW